MKYFLHSSLGTTQFEKLFKKRRLQPLRQTVQCGLQNCIFSGFNPLCPLQSAFISIKIFPVPYLKRNTNRKNFNCYQAIFYDAVYIRISLNNIYRKIFNLLLSQIFNIITIFECDFGYCSIWRLQLTIVIFPICERTLQQRIAHQALNRNMIFFDLQKRKHTCIESIVIF